MIENTNDFYIPFDELLYDAEKERRSINEGNLGSYGIDILDKFTAGIFPDELVVVGAGTGLGKSEVAYNIAVANAKKGKKVLLFALEGNISEIAWRYTQRQIASNGIAIRTQDYRANRNEDHKDIADVVIEHAYNEGRTSNLSVFNKKEVPTMEFLTEMIKTSSEYFDMFIIDHLHYISYSTRQNEMEQIGNIMREFKTLTDIYKKPVIVMSHLRKMKNKNDDPTEQDLYGSSNIAKEATTILLINKMDINNNDAWISSIGINEKVDYKRYAGTKFIIEKSRLGMPVRTNLAMIYDRHEKRYLDEYACLIKEESQASESDFTI